MRQRWSMVLAAAVTAALVLGSAGWVAARTVAGLRPDVGPPSTVGPLLGEQRWYGLLPYQLTDRLTLLVNVANGNLVLRQKDLSIKGTGLDLQVQQHYNSEATGSGSIGNRWVLDTGPDVRLQLPGDGSVRLQAPSGFTVTFLPLPGGYSDPPGLDASLVHNADGTYTLAYHQSGERYQFAADGHFTADVDANGNRTSFQYASTGGLSSIVDTQGRTTTVASGANGLISRITDPASRAYAFGYDAAANLTSYTDPAGGVARFAYDASANLTQITSPAGRLTRLSYDASHRVTTITLVSDVVSGTGPTTSFSYGSGTAAVTDPDQVRITYGIDSAGRVSQVADAVGAATSVAYTSDDAVATVVDPLGKQMTVSHDSRNNPSSVSLPTGAQATAAYGDTSHPYQASGVTDPQGNMTRYAYDAAGNLVQVTDAIGGVTHYAYNGNGTLSSITDALGNVSTYGYDTAGNLTGIFPTGLDYTYDGVSRVATTTDAKQQRTSYTYDALDRTTGVSYNDGSSTTQSFDADGNRTRLVDASGTTTFTYDNLGRLTGKTLPSGEAQTLGYDAAGNLTARGGNRSGTVTYGYNNLDLLSSLTDSSGARTTFEYDSDHRRTGVVYPNGVSVQYAWDGAGEITSVKAVSGGGQTLLQRQYGYVSPATGQSTLQRYSVSDAASSTTYGYDALNRLTSAVVKNGSGAVTDSRSYTYDAIGNRTGQTINGTTTSYTYDLSKGTITAGGTKYTLDANGNVTRIQTGSNSRSFSYNAANFTSAVLQVIQGCPSCAVAEIDWSMTYSGLDQSQRVAMTADTGTTTSFAYDSTGLVRRTSSSAAIDELRDIDQRLLAERTSAGTYYVIPDAAGSTIGLTDASGTLVGTWAYDPWGNVVAQTGSVSTPFLFQGAYREPYSIYKVNDRYYDPASGRYTQADSRQGSLSNPQTLNRYVFEGNDPTADPSVQQALSSGR